MIGNSPGETVAPLVNVSYAAGLPGGAAAAPAAALGDAAGAALDCARAPDVVKRRKPAMNTAMAKRRCIKISRQCVAAVVAAVNAPCKALSAPSPFVPSVSSSDGSTVPA